MNWGAFFLIPGAILALAIFWFLMILYIKWLVIDDINVGWKGWKLVISISVVLFLMSLGMGLLNNGHANK